MNTVKCHPLRTRDCARARLRDADADQRDARQRVQNIWSAMRARLPFPIPLPLPLSMVQ